MFRRVRIRFDGRYNEPGECWHDRRELVFLSVAAFGAGRILGLDSYVDQYEIDGRPLIERYPILDYVLG